MNDEKQRAKQIVSLPSLDADYCFGRPKTYLAPHELARLTILRSILGETCAEREQLLLDRFDRRRDVRVDSGGPRRAKTGSELIDFAVRVDPRVRLRYPRLVEE